MNATKGSTQMIDVSSLQVLGPEVVGIRLAIQHTLTRSEYEHLSLRAMEKGCSIEALYHEIVSNAIRDDMQRSFAAQTHEIKNATGER